MNRDYYSNSISHFLNECTRFTESCLILYRKGELPGEDVLLRVVFTPIVMQEKYMPAFLAVIYGNEAIARVEAVGA